MSPSMQFPIASVVACVLLHGGAVRVAKAQSSEQHATKPIPTATSSFHGPSLLLTIGTNLGLGWGIRPVGLFFPKIEAGLKWKTPWAKWDHLALGVGALFNPVVGDIENESVFNYAVYVSGHIRRSINSDWAVWVSGGPIVDCLECRTLVDFGFVASVALEYDSKYAATLGTQIIAFDLGRQGRPLGTEVNLFGGLRLRGHPAYLGVLPWFLVIGVGFVSALEST